MSNGLVFLGDYVVRDDGTVIGARGRALKPEVIRGGYQRVKVNGRKQLVHVLVAECHIGPRPTGYEVNHRDGDKTNNAVANLEYVTPKANVRHSLDVLGVRRARGERCGTSRLNERIVREIRSLYACGMTSPEIGKRFGINASTAHRAATGRTWSHVS